MSPPSLAHHFLTAAYQNAWADRRLIAFCQGMTDERLDDPMQVPRMSGVIIERFGRLLAHVFEHQIHHRGQVHAMLAGTHVKPPALDEFYCTNEDVLRAPDFAELGLTEEAIWGERARPPA